MIIENPSMVRFEGRWFLLYSGNRWQTTSYAVGYASCSGPLGPCTRGPNNPILRSAHGRLGPGGADALVDARGRLVAGYHAWESNEGTLGRGNRRMWMAQLESTGARLEVSSPVLSGGPEDEVLWTDVMATAPDRAAPVDPATFRVNGTYAPAVGDFDGDGFADVYWYGAWGRSDGGWAGTEQPGVFDETAMASSEQAGTFLPVAGDFDGDGDDDIYWYQPGGDPLVAETCCNHEPLARRDSLWSADGDGTFSPANLSRIATSIPVVGDFDADGAEDILWYGPGDAPDEVWVGGSWGGAGPPRVELSIRGDYRPVAGDFDGDGGDDVLWYSPGEPNDTLWMFGDDFTYSWSRPVLRGEAYQPFAGDFDGDGADEVFLYGPGSARRPHHHRAPRHRHVRPRHAHRHRPLHAAGRRLRRQRPGRRALVPLTQRSSAVSPRRPRGRPRAAGSGTG